MITKEMKQAMSTLSTFSEKEQHYYQYQARQEYLREQNTILHELEQAKKESEQAKKESMQAKKETAQAKRLIEAAKKREDLALAEIDQLKALLGKLEK
jgi:hypothetical protein